MQGEAAGCSTCKSAELSCQCCCIAHGYRRIKRLQQTVLSISAWRSRPVEMQTDSYLFLGVALLGCSAVFLCVWWKRVSSWVWSLAWSSWIGPIWNSKWTSEAAPSGNHSHGLGLSKQWELRVLSSRRTFQSCSRAVFALTPDSWTCPLNFSPTSVIVLLVPGAELSLSSSIISDYSSFFMLFLWHLLRLWHVLLKFWVSFLPRRNHTIPSAGLADYHSELAVWGSVRLLLLLRFLTLLLCVTEEFLLLRL